MDKNSIFGWRRFVSAGRVRFRWLSGGTFAKKSLLTRRPQTAKHSIVQAGQGDELKNSPPDCFSRGGVLTGDFPFYRFEQSRIPPSRRAEHTDRKRTYTYRRPCLFFGSFTDQGLKEALIKSSTHIVPSDFQANWLKNPQEYCRISRILRSI